MPESVPGSGAPTPEHPQSEEDIAKELARLEEETLGLEMFLGGKKAEDGKGGIIVGKPNPTPPSEQLDDDSKGTE